MGYIYVITNQINKKQYIGQTTYTIQERFKEHIIDAKKQRCEKRPLYDAFNKYGINNFTIEQLEECDNNLLNEREKYWINKLNTFHFGYNATQGGDGKIIYDYDLILQMLKDGYYSIDIQKKLNCDPDVIRRVAKLNNIKLKNKAVETAKIAIKCYDKKTYELIKEFSCIDDAAKWLIINNYSHTPIEKYKNIRGKISLAVRGQRKTAYGFIWKKEIDLPPSPNG